MFECLRSLLSSFFNDILLFIFFLLFNWSPILMIEFDSLFNNSFFGDLSVLHLTNVSKFIALLLTRKQEAKIMRAAKCSQQVQKVKHQHHLEVRHLRAAQKNPHLHFQVTPLHTWKLKERKFPKLIMASKWYD